MSKKIQALLVAAALLVFPTLPASADPPYPGSGFAGGFIFLDSFGASNATSIPGITGGDVLSGDLNSNLKYRGISDRGWLGPNLDTPGEACRGSNQATGSLWTVITPLVSVDPPSGALSAGYSKIKKDDGDVHLEMGISVVVWNSQTQMGFRPTGRGSVVSRPGILELTYVVTNVGNGPVLDLEFSQYLHPHPNGSCYDLPNGAPSHLESAIMGAYDPKLYKVQDPNFLDSQDFRFDLTFWAQDIVDGGVVYPGSTMGISALEPPSKWGIGDVGTAPPTPVCAANPDLLWCQVEMSNLANPPVSRAGPGHIGGALRWELPRLNGGHSVERHMLLAVSDDRPPNP